MKRLEIIHLRLAGALPVSLVSEVQKSVATEIDNDSVRIYHHATLANDLGIHLHLQPDQNEKKASALGVRLAAALREYGMVEHTVWIEEEVLTKGELK